MSLARRKIDPAKSQSSKSKIDEAIKLLDEAAEEARSEVTEMIRERYLDIEEKATSFMDEASEKIKEGAESVKDSVQTIDKEAHKNPWAFVGGAALGALAVGFLMGKLEK